MSYSSKPEFFIFDEVNSHFFFDGSWLTYNAFFNNNTRKQAYTESLALDYFREYGGINYISEFQEYLISNKYQKSIKAENLLVLSKTSDGFVTFHRDAANNISGQFNFKIERVYPNDGLIDAYQKQIQSWFGTHIRREYENISAIDSFMNSNSNANKKAYRYLSIFHWPVEDIRRIGDSLPLSDSNAIYSGLTFSTDYRYLRRVNEWLGMQLPGCIPCTGVNHTSYKRYKVLHDNPDDLLVFKMSTDIKIEKQINLYDEYEIFYKNNRKTLAPDFRSKVPLEGLYDYEKLGFVQ